MVRLDTFSSDGDHDYLGIDEEAVIIGKFHWLVWGTPLALTALIGILERFHGRNVLVIVATALIAVIALKVMVLRRWRLVWIFLAVVVVVGAAERYDGFLTWMFGAGVVFTGYKWLDHRWTTFILTTGRIVRRSGIFTTQTATMNLRALTDLRLEQPVLGQVLRYGHFMVESAGQQQAFTELRYVPAPEYFYQLVMTVALSKAPIRDPGRVLPPGWSYG